MPLGIKRNIIFFLCVDKLTDVTLLRSIILYINILRVQSIYWC